MSDFTLPLMRHRVVVDDEERGMVNCYHTNFVAIEPGHGAGENDYLINAVEWDTYLSDDGENIEIEEDSGLTQIWFKGANWDGSLEEGQYFYDPAPQSGMPKLVKVRSTEYAGPIGWGPILIEYIGRSKDMVDLDAVDEDWLDEYGSSFVLLEELDRMRLEE